MHRRSGPVRPDRAEPARNRRSASRPEGSPREIEVISSLPHEPGILVVDDDRGVRGMLALLLPRHGFVVWQAENGREALEVYERQRALIDLVLLDVCMPDLDGPQTLRALRGLNPGVRCCFMSGHGGAYTDDELLGMGVLRYFPKPFRLADLVHELKAVSGPDAEPAPAPVRQVFRIDVAPPPGPERRAEVRYLCQLQNFCRPIGRIGAGEIWTGRVRDISVQGLRLLLGRRFEPGTLLAVEIPGLEGEDPRQFLARVVRTRQEADGQWGVGCSFISDLSDEVLRELLAV